MPPQEAELAELASRLLRVVLGSDSLLLHAQLRLALLGKAGSADSAAASRRCAALLPASIVQARERSLRSTAPAICCSPKSAALGFQRACLWSACLLQQKPAGAGTCAASAARADHAAGLRPLSNPLGELSGSNHPGNALGNALTAGGGIPSAGLQQAPAYLNNTQTGWLAAQKHRRGRIFIIMQICITSTPHDMPAALSAVRPPLPCAAGPAVCAGARCGALPSRSPGLLRIPRRIAAGCATLQQQRQRLQRPASHLLPRAAAPPVLSSPVWGAHVWWVSTRCC
jgi:hypothetical protein